MWTAGTRAVGNPASHVDSSKNGVDERPANVGERPATVDMAARRAPAQFHNM
jgi:hypothetical protein